MFPQENEETLAQRSCMTRPRTQSAAVGLALCQIDGRSQANGPQGSAT